MSKDIIPSNVAKIIKELEFNGYLKEANEIRSACIKTADKNDNLVSDIESYGGDYILDKASDPLTDKVFDKFKGLKVTPGAAIKGFGAAWLTELGANELIRFFENSKGPYKVYEANKGDLVKILDAIKKLVKEPEVLSLCEEIKNLADTGSTALNTAKKQALASKGIIVRTAYNYKEFQKLAVRGNLEDRAPEYLNKLLVGALSGGVGGAFLGGLGAIPGAIVGGLGNVAYEGILDTWYASISNTGKAYFQGKDMQIKIYEMYNALKDIDVNTANSLSDKADGLLKALEKINLENKDKTALENLFQSVESKAKSGLGAVKEKAVETGAPIVNKALENVSTIIPSISKGRLI
jgi:hypothetical protein